MSLQVTSNHKDVFVAFKHGHKNNLSAGIILNLKKQVVLKKFSFESINSCSRSLLSKCEKYIYHATYSTLTIYSYETEKIDSVIKIADSNDCENVPMKKKEKIDFKKQ